MPYKKTIVCLANSRKKYPNRCVAGKELQRDNFGAWIRPVSDLPNGDLMLEHRRYEDGTDPKLSDVITISFQEARPQGCQKENHLIDSGTRWVLERRITSDELAPAVDHVAGPLWVNGHSGSNGTNDRIPEDIAKKLQNSLLLIEPEHLKISVAMEGGYEKPAYKKVRAQAVAFVGMSNVLSEAKKQQVIALGRLGWPLRRIEQEIGVRRETAGAYLNRDRSAPARCLGTATAGRTGQRKWGDHRIGRGKTGQHGQPQPPQNLHS